MSGSTNEMKTENDTNGQQEGQAVHNSMGRGGGRGGRNRFSGPGGRNRDDSRGGMRQNVSINIPEICYNFLSVNSFYDVKNILC